MVARFLEQWTLCDYISDACHTLTCAVMLLNTDLHQQVSCWLSVYQHFHL